MDYLRIFRESIGTGIEDRAIEQDYVIPEIVEDEADSSAPGECKARDSRCDIYLNIDIPDSEDTCSTRFFMRELHLPARVLDHDAVFLHSSYILWHGKAILFTAPKQTGKSTQARLWEQYKGAEIINGDRALLRRSTEAAEKAGQPGQSEQTERADSKMMQESAASTGNLGGWLVYGSPYCGTSGICKNKTAPLAAVVILGQAPENRIRQAAIGERVQAMLDGCSYDTSDRHQMQKVMDLTMNIVQEVPFIVLNCLPDHTAADALEEYLCRMKILS